MSYGDKCALVISNSFIGSVSAPISNYTCLTLGAQWQITTKIKTICLACAIPIWMKVACAARGVSVAAVIAVVVVGVVKRCINLVGAESYRVCLLAQRKCRAELTAFSYLTGEGIQLRIDGHGISSFLRSRAHLRSALVLSYLFVCLPRLHCPHSLSSSGSGCSSHSLSLLLLPPPPPPWRCLHRRCCPPVPHCHLCWSPPALSLSLSSMQIEKRWKEADMR